MVRKIPYYSLATILWVGALLLGTLLPGKELPEVSVKVSDKLVHLVLYLIMVFFFLYACWKENFLRIPKAKVLKVVSVISIVLAVGTEYLQSFIPGRTMSLYDVLSNVLGIILGIGLFLLTRSKS